MIYTGSDEIRGIMLGADEISAIYAGSEEIYPLTISGFTVKPLSLSFKMQGETKNIKITSEYPWSATTADSWITLGASSGASGRTTLSVTCGENQTGTELSGSVIVSIDNPASSYTVDIVQKTSLIPSDYQEIQYIYEPANNYAYIPTEIYMNSDMWFDFKLRATQIPGTPEKHIFSGDVFQAARVLANNAARVRRGGSAAITINSVYPAWNSGDVTFVEYKGDDNIVINGVTKGSFAAAEPYVDTQPGYFFSWRETDPGTTDNHLAMIGYLYYFIIGSNTTGDELYHFVPVKRKSDDLVGLYEIVNGEFYGPGNNKHFTAGPDVVE